MTLAVCVAGATGWTGRAVAEAVLAADDLDLRTGVSRSSGGRDLGEAWGGTRNGVPVHAQVGDALEQLDQRMLLFPAAVAHGAGQVGHRLQHVGAASVRAI